MSVIPEVVLHRTIIQGFRSIRKDPRIIDSLFKNIDQAQLAEIKKFIIENSIDFSINYPRKTPNLPALVMLMKGEKESQTFLGDIMGASPNYEMPDTDMTETLGDGASISGTSGLTELLLGNVGVQSATGTKVYFAEDDLGDIEELLEGFDGNTPTPVLYVTSGTGVGQTHIITAMDSISLDIHGTFDPQLDSSSVLDIRSSDDSELASGEPSRVYKHDNTDLIRRGANYSVQYQLNVLAGNQEEVIYLYVVLKALLYSQKKFLEGQGIQALELSGSDFAPRSEFIGNEVFQRIMTLSFVYDFHFLEEIETAGQICIDLTADDPNEPHANGVLLRSIVEI